MFVIASFSNFVSFPHRYIVTDFFFQIHGNWEKIKETSYYCYNSYFEYKLHALYISKNILQGMFFFFHTCITFYFNCINNNKQIFILIYLDNWIFTGKQIYVVYTRLYFYNKRTFREYILGRVQNAGFSFFTLAQLVKHVLL